MRQVFVNRLFINLCRLKSRRSGRLGIPPCHLLGAGYRETNTRLFHSLRCLYTCRRREAISLCSEQREVWGLRESGVRVGSSIGGSPLRLAVTGVRDEADSRDSSQRQ